MSFRVYVLFMAISTLVAWVGWAVILWNINPFESGMSGFLLFYITLITGLIGLLSLLGVLYRVVFLKRKDVVLREVKVSFRHAILLSFVGVSALALSSHGLLIWWVLILLILVASLIEYVSLLVQNATRG